MLNKLFQTALWGTMRTVLLIMALGAAGTAYADQTAESLIQSLYQAHQPWAGKHIDLTNKAELSRFFDPGLVKQFLAEHACQVREQGICNLDSDPILCAQDFDDNGISNLSIASTAANTFSVTFENLGPNKLVYTMRKTNVGWRVHDIQCPEGPSLKNILAHG